MKSTSIIAFFFISACLFLSPALSDSALKPSSAEVNKEGRAFSGLLRVAVAREPVYLILVEKNHQRLRVLEYDSELRIVADFPCATGENFGIKELSGDSKTPEGIYFITQIFKDDEITIFGDKAFHLDYPNFFDQQAGRNGDGIYIHGTNKELQPNSTNGCVTLANNDLDNLENYLNQVVTPVVIVPEFNDINVSNLQLLTDNDFSLAKTLLLNEEIKSENVEYNFMYIVSFGDQTVAVSDFTYRPFPRSIMRGASRIYLEYLPDQGWNTRKRIWWGSPLMIFPEAPVKVAAHPLSNSELLLAEQTPDEAGAMVAALTPKSSVQQSVVKDAAPSVQVDVDTPPVSRKTERVAMSPAPVPPEKKPQPQTPSATIAPPTSKPRAAKAEIIEQPQKIAVAPPDVPKDKQRILEFVENWRLAWTSKEIAPYIAFYDESFRSGDKNFAQWKSHKENLNKTYEYINVNISDIKVTWTDKGATVTFRQEYSSDRYSATGNKTLFLIYRDHSWKIMREVYARI